MTGSGLSPLVAAPYFAAAGLLVASGWAKLRYPGPAVKALSEAGIGWSSGAVRGVAAVELVVGTLCLGWSGRPASLVLTLLYVVFAGFLARLILRPGQHSCGCAGNREAAASPLHVALDLMAAATGLMVAWRPLPGIVGEASSLPLWGLPFLAAVTIVACQAYLVVAYAPTLLSSYRRRSSEGSQRPVAFTVGGSPGGPSQ